VQARVSIAMIVRDEAEHLGACLAQVAGLGAELVVVDTGSADGTPEIARAAGAQVSSFAWCDDFAAARNAALAQCTAPWIFVLDADERIAPEDLPALATLCAQAPDCAYQFTTRNYTDQAGTAEFVPSAPDCAEALGFAGWFPSVKVRLFPNRPGVRFAGAVHETVQASLLDCGIPIAHSALPIHHYGLRRAPSRLAAKRDLYLRLGEAKVAAQPGDAQAHAELGRQRLELDDLAGALRAFGEAVRLAPGQGEYLLDLGSALLLAGREAQASQALSLAVRHAPELVDAWRNLGIAHAGAQRWAEARGCFAEAARLNPRHGELRRYLAIALAQCGDSAGAAREAEAALAAQPHDAQTRALYEEQLTAVGRAAEAAARLASLS
jgi:Flp pilus assembly protein TadD